MCTSGTQSPQSCAPITATQCLGPFPSPRKILCSLCTSVFPPQPQATSNLLSRTGWPILDISHRRESCTPLASASGFIRSMGPFPGSSTLERVPAFLPFSSPSAVSLGVRPHLSVHQLMDTLSSPRGRSSTSYRCSREVAGLCGHLSPRNIHSITREQGWGVSS